jgi:hypothetical protein
MKTVWKFLNTRIETIQILLTKPQKGVSPQTFQRLASELEKTEAFLGLLKAADPGFHRKSTFRPFKKLVRLVNEISSLQVEERMLNQWFAKDQLTQYKRDVRKIKESKRERYFLKVSGKFVSKIKNLKEELEPFLRQTDKEVLSKYTRKKRKKISKILQKKDFKVSKLEDLRQRVKEYNILISIIGKQKAQKDPFEVLLDAWGLVDQQIDQIGILSESGVFSTKESALIKKVDEKLNLQEVDLIHKIREMIPESGFGKRDSKSDNSPSGKTK